MMTELRHLGSPSIYTPTPFAIQKRTTTTTNRWWCGGATQRETERRERENRRSKTRTAGRSIYPVVGVKSPAVQDFIQRVFRADAVIQRICSSQIIQHQLVPSPMRFWFGSCFGPGHLGAGSSLVSVQGVNPVQVPVKWFEFSVNLGQRSQPVISGQLSQQFQ
ncbi:hypothetical protein HanXRQr2_Chr04g0157621 [Helianthus annuus]|uniref:Uncharacterized protein n=1 Tax=Helianthus annuus TaxID=4232 RepID=A0A251UZL7_HELAN|nr:hypothetical protein HanXRQr2_Chr04g0157621 [Helianthus annuus]KAJ0588046.1 hypothetical protein HanIR_Chr04g0170101 [Helianthus annuus]